MGSFYTNFTLKLDDAAAVSKSLRNANRDAFIAADAKAHCVLVCDREADKQDPSVIVKLGTLLSKEHGCPVLAASNEDDDVFRYWLFDSGEMIDTFDSSFELVSEQNFVSPSGARVVIAKFDPRNPASASLKPAPRRKDERGGNVQSLSSALGVPVAAEKVLKVLLKEYDFVLEQHRAFCKALGLSSWAVGASFEYLAAGQLPKGLSKSHLIRVGYPDEGA
jgi:hypothetical protein